VTSLEKYKIYYEGLFKMDKNIAEKSIIKPVTTRKYDIKETRYIVTATTRDGASQDAAAIVRRLIQKDIHEVN
jgi:hypothetical protein